MIRPIYLDYAATTPMDPRVVGVMTECLTLDGNFANPASRSHRFGWQAEEAVENARRQVADLINADPREVVWTSGATEANNLAIKGIAQTVEQGHFITSAIEHKAVLDCFAWLEQQGHSVTYLQPSSTGIITVEQVSAAVTDDTKLVSLMQVNNELGVINPIPEIGALCRSRGILLHVDAAQSTGKISIDVVANNIDLLSISAHKIYGPKGMGALFVRRQGDFTVAAQIHGGGHERGMRSGTLATHQIVAMGCALDIARTELGADQQHVQALAKQLLAGLASEPEVVLNAESAPRIANILNLRFAGFDGDQLMMVLRDLAVSSGSACTSASVEPSHVLTAIGLNRTDAHSSLRFSIGRFTQAADIDRTVTVIKEGLTKLRALSD